MPTLNSKQYDVAIIIVNYNLTGYIQKLINSIIHNVSNLDYKIIVVDNDSDENPKDLLERIDARVSVLRLDKNYGFGYANNRGMSAVDSAYYYLINPDTIISRDVITPLFKYCNLNPEIGLIGTQILNENGKKLIYDHPFPFTYLMIADLFFLGNVFVILRQWVKRIKYFSAPIIPVDYVHGSSMFLSQSVFHNTGGFDEDFFLFAEETELAFRVRNQLKLQNAVLKDEFITHFVSKSTGKDLKKRFIRSNDSLLLFFKKTKPENYKYLARIRLLTFILRRLKAKWLRRKDDEINMYDVLIKHYKENI